MMSAFFYFQPKVINLCYKIIKLVLLEILRGVQIDVCPPPPPPPPSHPEKTTLALIRVNSQSFHSFLFLRFFVI